MSQFYKIRNIFTNHYQVIQNSNQYLNSNNLDMRQTPLIIFSEYKRKYIKHHTALASFFKEYLTDPTFSTYDRDKFIQFLREMSKKGELDDSELSFATGNVKKVDCSSHDSKKIAQGFIAAYTGENVICYLLNKWLRNVDINQYDNGLKCFSGPFLYSLYKLAHDYPEFGVQKDKIFYRKMTIKLADLHMYKACEGEVICYPAFTSTSEEDISKYNFPTYTACHVNNLKASDISVVLKINYKHSYGNITPAISVDMYSVNKGEREFIFPPFSFFKIKKVELYGGTGNNPHVIYLDVINKKNYIEIGLKNNKVINYDESTNTLSF